MAISGCIKSPLTETTWKGIKGDRVVIGIGSTVTAAVNMKDLAKA